MKNGKPTENQRKTNGKKKRRPRPVTISATISPEAEKMLLALAAEERNGNKSAALERAIRAEHARRNNRIALGAKNALQRA